MSNYTSDLLEMAANANSDKERRDAALILADREERGDAADAKTVRIAVENGKDGPAAALSVPSGGAGQAAGDLKVIPFKGQTLRFRWCPPGSFVMGTCIQNPFWFSNENQVFWFFNEKQVNVNLTHGFWMAEVPVTQELWVTANGPKLDWSQAGAGPRLPAYNVNHHEALAFAASLTEQLQALGQLPVDWKLSLPTEAQWEYACRAGTKTTYSWGDDKCQAKNYAWHAEDEGNMDPCCHDVGTLQPNGWGIHDMLGNVWEWCLDGWSWLLPGGEDPLVDFSQYNQKVLRGSSWCYPLRFCRSAQRYYESSKSRNFDYGFRLSIQPMSRKELSDPHRHSTSRKES